MFDILKDSNNRFNKKNILPLVGTATGSIMAPLTVVRATLFYCEMSNFREHEDYGSHLAKHMFLMAIITLAFILLTYLSIDNIRKNKQIEDRKANPEPSSRIYNALVDDVSEEQSVV